LWAPWRLSYIEKSTEETGCIFCYKPELPKGKRRDELVLLATERASVIMNRYPYASGHLMVAPRVHSADFAGLDPESAAAVHGELQTCVRVLTRAYNPAGFNIGINLGRVAGAGIADHMHWHVVPRWQGDTNFMPMLAETRVISQHLTDAYDRLAPLFEEEARR
jgi:ATP adenylyltransferase